MPWTVTLKPSVINDLLWFGKKVGRLLLDESERQLSVDPLAETKNMKTLRPNKVAQRELRLFGKYRILFNTDNKKHEVTIILVGEKRGSSLIVQGKEFTERHESDSS